MNILVIGQCTLHWGRMEFGNIGNFYIMEPFFRELHKAFPNANIKTTFQMSERFCVEENILSLPMDLYYGFEDDFEKAKKELAIAKSYLENNTLTDTTPYIDIVKEMDLVIDFSGDIWGDNADFLGDDRFFVGLVKDRVAQIFAKKTAMVAGSPGPFSEGKNLEFAHEVFENFDLVTNRESISNTLLEADGFDISKSISLTCPAFLFEPAPKEELKKFESVKNILSNDRKSIGFLICGWNFTKGPFDKWPRTDEDYIVFANAIERFSSEVDVDIFLMSHSNGFPIPPEKFSLIRGRDFPIMEQLMSVLQERGNAKNVFLLDEIYNAWETKAILSAFDMVVSGRVHAAVGAMSQLVPTVIIDYGHEPKAHKLKGFADVANQLKNVAQPDVEEDLYKKMITVWKEKKEVEESLRQSIPDVKKKAIRNFEMLKSLFE